MEVDFFVNGNDLQMKSSHTIPLNKTHKVSTKTFVFLLPDGRGKFGSVIWQHTNGSIVLPLQALWRKPHICITGFLSTLQSNNAFIYYSASALERLHK